MAAHEAEQPLRAAVQALAPELDEMTQQTIARTLARLVPVLARRPGGPCQVTLQYTPGRAQPRIDAWQGVMGWVD